LCKSSCREKLGRRLIFDRRAEDEHEIGMLTLLKQKCGIQFTSKMDLMLKDITISREHQIRFDEFVAERPELNPRIKLSVAVLTPANWPSYNTAKIHLPAEMVSSLFDIFNNTIAFISWKMLVQCCLK
jgi:cullin 1